MAKLYESKNWLYQKYVIENKNLSEIAKEASCSHMTINRYLEKFGIKK